MSLLLYKYDMNKKIEQFVKRNRYRNNHLYNDKLKENKDYIVCPVSKERLSMIKKSYVERVLEMSVEEYDKLYPGVRGVSDLRKQNIKKGLHQIDLATGKTKYQLSQEKAKETLSRTDKSGISGYKKKGLKTRNTHMNNLDEFGRNGYSRLATKAILKGNLTKAEKGLILHPDLRNEFYRYKSIVLYVTEKFRKYITEGYKTGVAGTFGAYHIDHAYSIMNGYKNNISPLVIGNISNLQMLPWKENLSKHGKSSITLDELLSKTNYTVEQSQKEFCYFINEIQKDIQQSAPVSGAVLMERFYESTLCE
jgi:hypothetical protein